MVKQLTIYSTVILIIISSSAQAQDVNPGYTLYAARSTGTTYLIDIDGDTVHTWQSNYDPAASEYLLEDTTLLRTAILSLSTRFRYTGGCGGRVERFDWNSNLLWSYEHASNNYMLHHDIEMLPNGNILMIAWEYKTRDQAIAAGRNPSLVTTAGLWPDKIIEVEPTGSSGGNIVWEWHAWDHLIQDYDATKANYGVVADHPELINLNFASGSSADWMHSNAVNYNPELDQILLTIRNLSEIWVIDHSTTTAEAASHSGGNSGKGGDLLYRWGNPQAYGRGTSADRKLFGPHDARWIEPNLPGEDDILIFNNGNNRPGGNYSSVDQITTPVQPDGSYYLAGGSAYGPANANWIYTDTPPSAFYAASMSGARRLPNGNTLICDGPGGDFFEVTTDKAVVWEYDAGAQVFRATRYSPDYPGLANIVDNTPPSPNPMTWASVPAASGAYSIEMTATTAIDDNPYGVEYFFDCLTAGGHDSGWQDETYYEDTGLNPNTEYFYSVQARDKSPNQNETGWSSSLPATTWPPDTTPPEPDPMTWASLPTATGSSTITMTATTATDDSPPAEYYFECTNYGDDANSDWQTSPTYVATGLNPETEYTFRVKARDSAPARNETGWSSDESATTPSGPLAWDDFESGNGTGGAGWSDNWSLSGYADVTTSGTAYEGSYHLRLRSNTGVATRTSDMTGVTNAQLKFYWKANSFESGETSTVEVYDGSWHTVLTVSDGQDDNTYHPEDIDISSYNMVSGFQVRIQSNMSGTYDYFYIDNIEIFGVAGPPPPGQASNPNPADLATGVDINADLSWTAGSGATSHDVYFGTTSPSDFQGNQTETTFEPGTMANYTTYYWRIDEKNAGGTTTGNIWKFTTEGIAPVITSTPVTAATVNQPYSYDVDADGIPAPSYSLIVSPAGMAIDANTGVISWTPDANQLGLNGVTVEAANTEGSDTQGFTITVLPSDDFNDNRRSAMWQLFVEDYYNMWVSEDANRLNARATGDANDLIALYTANGWSFDINENFAIEVDFYYSKISERRGWVGIAIENNDCYALISTGSDSNESYFYYETFIDGNVVLERELRDSNDGTLYIWYDANSNNMYLSHVGYGDVNAYNWQTSPDLLQGLWESPVDVTIGGGSDRVPLGPGEAYLDNFKIISAGLLGWPPATDLDSDGFIGWGDIETMSEHWLSDPNTNPDMKGDINKDEIVNFLDFAELAPAW